MSTAVEQCPAWRELYPFASHELQLNGRRIHYLDEGPEDAAETLLLVHGNPTWSFHWRELICAWRGARRLVAPDHLGCGLSDKPAEANYTLAGHCDRLQALIATLDLRNMTLVAQDWGGAIGLGAALAMPERFRRIVLLNTGAFRPWFIPWRIRVCRTPLLGPLALRGLNLFSRAALRMAMEHPEQLSPAVRQGYLAPYDSWANRVAVMRFVEDIPLSDRHPTWHTLGAIEDGLPRLAHLPVQLIWGMHDWCFTPECLERFERAFPQAETVRLTGAGHWVLEDAPDDVRRQMEAFFQRHPLNAAPECSGAKPVDDDENVSAAGS